MSARKHRSRRGFTLLELMVALMITGLVVAALFTLGGASARHFHEQQRIGVTQRGVRMAMDRVRRDFARAGYLSVPDTGSTRVRMCPTPAVPRRVQAIWFDDADATGVAALDGVNRAANLTSADRVRLTGNYSTGESYLVRSFDGAGNTITLQTDWIGFRRSFINTVGATTFVDTARFASVFSAGRMLHVESPNGYHFFFDITGSSLDGTGQTASITISPGVGTNNPCLRGLGRGAIVSPISQVEYFIGTPGAGSMLEPRNVAVTGNNTLLVRRELNMANGAEIAGTRRVLLEWAVDFNVDFVLDTRANLSLPPAIITRTGALAETDVQGTPANVRGAIVSIAGRTPEQDIRYPWPASWGASRPTASPLNRYQVFPTRPGAARVRQLTTEILMPNLVP
jgi:prepilin-type N-terminal cleavage/methylation domain-containing protein